jgi:hypothetical protein
MFCFRKDVFISMVNKCLQTQRVSDTLTASVSEIDNLLF